MVLKNVMYLDEFKDKIKQVIFDKYGVESASQLEWVKEKDH